MVESETMVSNGEERGNWEVGVGEEVCFRVGSWVHRVGSPS